MKWNNNNRHYNEKRKAQVLYLIQQNIGSFSSKQNVMHFLMKKTNYSYNSIKNIIYESKFNFKNFFRSTQLKYPSKIKICPICNHNFISYYHSNSKTKYTEHCSKHCATITLGNRMKGKKLSIAKRLALKKVCSSTKSVEFKRIMKQKKFFESRGYKFVPLCKVLPDAIAVKGEIIAIEDERAKYPNYNKYKGIFKKSYDDIIWIRHKKPIEIISLKNHMKDDCITNIRRKRYVRNNINIKKKA